jgi:hypothetical protein
LAFSGVDSELIRSLDAQPILRNLLITQGYHELSSGFAAALGPQDVTWFTFASWSSKVVGQFLQNDELPTVLQQFVAGWGSAAERLQHLNTTLKSLHVDAAAGHRAVEDSMRSAINDMRLYLALGNTEVYCELAPVFMRFLDAFGLDKQPDLAKLEQFLGSLRAGAITPDQVAIDPATQELKLIGRGGQNLLKQAVRHYYSAKFEPDPKRRAELVLFANANIGLHEQTRLQTYIAGALDAPIENTLIDSTHDSLAERLGDDALGSDGYEVVDALLGPLSSSVQTVFHHFATEFMMTLKLPDVTLRLGRDLPAPPGQPLFPSALETLRDAQLAQLFNHYDTLASRGDPLSALRQLEAKAEGLLERLGLESVVALGSGADDWVSLAQRMRFILELFRSRQQSRDLLQPVFMSDQVTALKAGRIPPGPLT